MKTNILVSTENLSTEEWLRWRQKGIGGSDVAPILGISKWTSSIDIWLSKTNQKCDNCVQKLSSKIINELAESSDFAFSHLLEE